MTTTNPEQRKMVDNLSRYVERETLRVKGTIKESMENLTEDFNENFMWDAEKIFKGNLRLQFLEELRKLIEDDKANIEAMRFYLRHAAEHAADDIMHRDPYNHSSNSAANLAYRWEFENYKQIYALALNLLYRITLDAE